MIILACAGTAQSGAGSKKKAQDMSDSLPGLAVQCIAALLGLCRSTADLAHLLVLLPELNSPGLDCELLGQMIPTLCVPVSGRWAGEYEHLSNYELCQN